MSEQAKCILMDPPWEEYGGGHRGAQNHYSLMRLSEIAKTVMRAEWADRAPVFDPAPNAHLWVWTTDNYLLDALSLIDQVGFHYKRTFVWVKMVQHPLMGRHGADAEPGHGSVDIARRFLQIGLGQYARGAHELLLFATRGRAQVPPPERRPPSVIFAPRTEHSAKPDESYKLIEQVSPWPKLEMFARGLRPKWRSWGDEAQEAAP